MYIYTTVTIRRNSVDSDHDGRINLPQFCTAMSLINQAKGAGGGGGGVQMGGGLQGSSLHSSLPSSAVSQFVNYLHVYTQSAYLCNQACMKACWSRVIV